MNLAIVIPYYKTPVPLLELLEQIEPYWASTIIVDDGSKDLPNVDRSITVIQNSSQLGYGASQKIGYTHALAQEIEGILLLHGDGQYRACELLQNAHHLSVSSVVLASRMLVEQGARIPFWRRWGNKILTNAANIQCATHFSDLHTGGRLYKKSFLSAAPLASFSDDFVFDQELLIWGIRNNRPIVEFPYEAHYGPESSSISMPDAIRYGLQCLSLLTAPSIEPKD